jgi:polyisoprenyl-teichoic acid--peptidoglycan teichoic acid transferase
MKLRLFIGFACVALVAGVLTSNFVRDRFQQAIATRSADNVFHSRRLNILLLGYQADEGNSDTIILAHLDIDRRTATLVSIPRDTWVEIPGHGHQKINAAIGLGGPHTSAKVVSTLVGVPIDATIAVQPEGAKQLVDAMGGMNVNVEHDMDYDDNYGELHIHLKKGEQYLTGGQVLEYIRFRNDVESDWGRVRRQQAILKSLLDQLSQPQNWAKLPKLLTLARSDITTDLGDKQLAALLEIYRGVPDDDVRTFTMPARATFIGDASVVIVDERWAHIIGSLLFSKHVPPQDQVLVANASGVPALSKKLVSALRGGGWNVATFIEQPTRSATTVYGSDEAALFLAKLFGVSRKGAKTTTLLIGRDFVPQED